MKFLPTSFRETQRDWFGKKGKPWHVLVAITAEDKSEIEVCSCKICSRAVLGIQLTAQCSYILPGND